LPHIGQIIIIYWKETLILVNLILQYSNENDIVLDNCAGSGSLGHACITTNRKYILIEKDLNEYNKINL
jgi:site-specific DNA-methyltransferase (adenine-specific)